MTDEPIEVPKRARAPLRPWGNPKTRAIKLRRGLLALDLDPGARPALRAHRLATIAIAAMLTEKALNLGDARDERVIREVIETIIEFAITEARAAEPRGVD